MGERPSSYEVVRSWGAYATVLEAYLEAMRRFTPGTFMLQRCEPGPEAYTVTISTRDLFCQAPA